MADQTEMKALHMFTTGDPARNATFAYFADANYFLTDFPTSTCETCINPAFAWNHGDIQEEIGQTWLGFVGPGRRSTIGVTAHDWTDTPTCGRRSTLLGLRDDYEADGRVIPRRWCRRRCRGRSGAREAGRSATRTSASTRRSARSRRTC